ncbi:unnamed protein product [Oncorhynchus mykiss]|uniref:UDENN domain-containing protein n=1 Tax=Oncorhynchus mykiss TaxID=8022 RepID=A0A060XS82_ONCMY|nr:unnamed protein product [Oncorhynchus mykiss]
MTANKSSKAAPRARGANVPRDIPDRCQSASPPPILSATQGRCHAPLSDSEDNRQHVRYVKTDGRLLGRAGCSSKTASLCSGASLSCDLPSQSRLTKSKSISCLDNKLSIYKPSGGAPVRQEAQEEQKENQKQEDIPGGGGLSGGPLSWSTLSLGPSSKHGHKRTLSLSRPVSGASSVAIRKKISEWECRRVALPRMSLCLEKRPVGERVGGSEGCPSLLPSPCSEKTFDFKSIRRMSTAFSECSYPETEEEEAASDRECLGRFQKRPGKTDSSSLFLSSLSARKETSAVLNRIQKIEKVLKESPSQPPRYLSNCYAPDKTRQKCFMIGGVEDLDSRGTSKRSSICSVATEPDALPASDKLSRQRFSVSSTRSETESLEPPCQQTPEGMPVNPLPKPKRTFEYDANRNHKGMSPINGLPPDKKENPYEDVDLKRRSLGRKNRLVPESSRTWTSQKLNSPPQLPSKPSSQSLRLSGPTDKKSHRASRLSKRHSHDDMLLLPPHLGVSPSPCCLLDDSLSSASDTLASRRHRRIPKIVQRINSIYSTKRGKKRLKKLSLSNIETASLRDDNSESESDSDDRFKGCYVLDCVRINMSHTQRLLKLQSMLRRAPSYRTLELQLIEWQERELFEYFVVVSLKKKPTKNSFFPEVTYQFPKLERPTKLMREAEQRLKAIPQFCFPDAKDWTPVSEYSSETFSFMLTGEDGSRRFGYCRRLLVSKPPLIHWSLFCSHPAEPALFVLTRFFSFLWDH